MHATGGFKKTTVSWDPPAANGGAITGYDIYAGFVHPSDIVGHAPGDATSFDVPQTGQYCTPNCTPSTRTTPWTELVVHAVRDGPAVCPPHPPTSVKVVPGDGQATLNWEPYSDDGGSPVTGFTAYAVSNSGWSKKVLPPDARAVTFDGLTNGEYDHFEVIATNAAGDSVESKTPYAPRTPPSPSPTATPSATPTPTVSATPTTSVTPSVNPTPSVSPSVTPTPSPTPTPSGPRLRPSRSPRRSLRLR